MAEYKKTDLKNKIDTDFADNTTGDITAKIIRDNLNHMVDSVIPIMASGTDTYFANDVDIRGSAAIGSADTKIGHVAGQWDKTNVSSIEFVTGADTSNKDDGHIYFKTSSASSDPRKRLSIQNDGRVIVHGSGTTYAGFTVNSIHGSGVNILVSGSDKDIAYPSGTHLNIGEWHSGSSAFTRRMVINNKGHVGFNVTPEQPLHIRASGESIRLDSRQHSNSDLMLSKFKTGGGYGKDDYYVGFGLGVSTEASGAGRFYIGVDNNRDYSVGLTDAIVVLDSGGRLGVGNNNPNEKLVVGDDLGGITADGNAAVIGASFGNSRLYVGSGVAVANTANYGRLEWESADNRLTLATRKGMYTKKDQLVLDATNGNVGVGHSGIPFDVWRPNYNLHVSASGNSATVAVENAMGKEAAIYIGKNTEASGVTVYPSTTFERGHWSVMGYKTGSEVFKINNSGSFVPSHFSINRDGDVGINTDSPYSLSSIGTDRLHVYGDNSSVVIGNPAGGTNSALRLLGSRSTNNTAYVQAGTSSADTNAKLSLCRFDTDSTNISEANIHSDLIKIHGNFALNGNWISNDGGSEGIKVGDGGNVAVGKAPGGTYTFELNSGQGAQPTSTLWINTSDQRVKEDISTIDTSTALTKIMQLRPVSFKYTEDFCHCIDSDHDKVHYNFLAQEVETVFPDSVIDTDSNIEDRETGAIAVSNVKGLDAHAINIHLVAAVQELKTQLDAALTRISDLESS